MTMKTNLIELNINIGDVSLLRISINGKTYRLSPDCEEMTADHIVDNAADGRQTSKSQVPTVANYISQLENQLRKEKRFRTAETYRSTLHSFTRFLPNADIEISDIDATLIMQYEHFLKGRGLCRNSSSYYMRVLRTIYLQAVESGYTPNRHPFEHVYTGYDKTVKRAISLEAIRAISQLKDLDEHEELARDMFLFSFYTRGMSFIDMAYLKPSNVRNGILTYRRHKTGQELMIRWEKPMQEIIDRHPSNNPDYLLPIIKRSNGRERSQYRDGQRKTNELLKVIGKKAQLEQSLSMYVARHSWASIARTMNIPVGVISEAMGHNSEQTTQIYLKALDSSRIDTANAAVIQALLS